MDVETLDRWAAPAAALGGGIGLAAWSIYWDYRRRVDPDLRDGAGAAEPAGSKSLRRGAVSARIGDPLGIGVALAGIGAALRILAGDERLTLAVAAYGAGIAGVAFLAVYLFRRCEARERGNAEED